MFPARESALTCMNRLNQMKKIGCLMVKFHSILFAGVSCVTDSGIPMYRLSNLKEERR